MGRSRPPVRCGILVGMRLRTRRRLALALAVGLAGCAGPYGERREGPVVRRFGERLVEGPYVSPAAYEHYIRAMLREAAGRPDEAVDELRRALGSNGTSAYLRVRLADALLSTGRVDEARDELDAALRLEPENAEAYVVKARLHGRLGERAAVENALERAIALDPAAEEPSLMLAALQRDTGREDRALATLRALAARTSSATAEEALGRAALKTRDRAAAREQLRRAVELDGARNEARVELARIALGDGDADLGLQLLASAAERTRELTLSLELAHAAALAGRLPRALAVLDRLEEDAQTPSARLEVATAFLDVGVPRRAALIADAVLVEEPRAELRAAARALVARAAEATGSIGDALAAWQAIGPADAEYATSLLQRARLLRARGHDRDALALIEAGIAERTARGRLEERDQLAIGLAALRVELGEGAAAVDRLVDVAATRPHATELRVGLAHLERQVGRAGKAVALLQPLAAAGDPRVLRALGEALLEVGPRPDEALRILERAEGAAPHDAAVAGSLGTAYLRAGRLEDAERLLRRADRLAPPSAEVLQQLARLLERRDRRDDAAAVLRRALQARPAEALRQQLEAQLLMLERGRVGSR